MKKTALIVLLLYLSVLVGMFGVGAEPVVVPEDSVETSADVPETYTGSATVTILYTSDINGNFLKNKDTGTLGYSGIAAVHRSIPGSILVDSGNYLISSTFLAQNNVENVVSLMNASGYLLAGIGDADLANGSAALRGIQESATFHMLSSNITTGADREPLLETTRIVDIKGVKIGFFSLLNPEIRLSASVQEWNDLYLEDASKTAQDCVNSLKQQGADMIIALSHVGSQGSTTIDQIAAFVSGIDLILDGYDDHAEKQERYVGETMIFNSDNNCKKLLQLDLVFGANKSLRNIVTTQWLYESVEGLPIDETVTQMEEGIMAERTAFLEEGLVTSRVELPYRKSILYQSEPLGNFIADAYRAKTGATIAIVDSGSIGAGIKKGLVTKADLLAILPENRTIQTKRVTPKTLKTALENGVSGLSLLDEYSVDPSTATAKFPQISGCTVAVNLKNDPGNRIVKIVLDNGVNLNLNDDFTSVVLAGSHTILSGKNDYDILALQPVADEYGSEGQALLNYLSSQEEYPDYDQVRMQTTDKQESYAGIIIMMFAGLAIAVAALVFIIKLLAKLS